LIDEAGQKVFCNTWHPDNEESSGAHTARRSRTTVTWPQERARRAIDSRKKARRKPGGRQHIFRPSSPG
ncbi:MAG: hypothetical protein WCQ50_04575, partial [Spirochaetota bacterium]